MHFSCCGYEVGDKEGSCRECTYFLSKRISQVLVTKDQKCHSHHYNVHDLNQSLSFHRRILVPSHSHTTFHRYSCQSFTPLLSASTRLLLSYLFDTCRMRESYVDEEICFLSLLFPTICDTFSLNVNLLPYQRAKRAGRNCRTPGYGLLCSKVRR